MIKGSLDMGRDPVARVIVTMALPAMMSMFFRTFMNS